MTFPQQRLRRLRKNEQIRRLVRETEVNPGDLILPLFVVHGKDVKTEISTMPGVYQTSVDETVKIAKEAKKADLGGIILFGIPEVKDEAASEAYASEGIVQQAIREIKEEIPELLVVTDVCLCEYMSHGHCGIIKDNEIQNDISLELLAQTAVSHAEAGADIVAPSDMMDGRVAAIRNALDENGKEMTPIMSYAVKYASAMFSPFREAAESAPAFGDRRSYQMDPANITEASREVELDVEEGADIVMVKPAIGYLDVVSLVYRTTDLPVAAYNVSGEYAMVKAAVKAGMIDEKKTVLEILTSIKRAGAGITLSYHALDAAKWL
jgi:porphobilinogen synthase